MYGHIRDSAGYICTSVSGSVADHPTWSVLFVSYETCGFAPVVASHLTSGAPLNLISGWQGAIDMPGSTTGTMALQLGASALGLLRKVDYSSIEVVDAGGVLRPSCVLGSLHLQLECSCVCVGVCV